MIKYSQNIENNINYSQKSQVKDKKSSYFLEDTIKDIQ
jgi:hypothetical protein